VKSDFFGALAYSVDEDFQLLGVKS